MCLFRVEYEQEDPTFFIQSSVAIFECRLREAEDGALRDLELLDMEFFDDETLVIVHRQGPSGE